MEKRRVGSHSGLWDLDNLFAWCVVQYDAAHRGPAERSAMLKRLGFSKFAFDWGSNEAATFDAEIEALKRHQIDLIGWWLLYSDPDDAAVGEALEAFARHGVTPHLWIDQPLGALREVEWSLAWPAAERSPDSFEDAFARLLRMPERDALAVWEQLDGVVQAEAFPATEFDHERRVEREALRAKSFADRARPYGCRVDLYGHGGWLGRTENQLAVIDQLGRLGVTDVGIVYNFVDARDEHHDDAADFGAVWDSIRPHVRAVNIAGVGTSNEVVNLSQGDHELAMMRVIEESGWHGPVGVYVHAQRSDAEEALKTRLRGLEWLRAELTQPGSGGNPTAIPVIARL